VFGNIGLVRIIAFSDVTPCIMLEFDGG